MLLFEGFINLKYLIIELGYNGMVRNPSRPKIFE
jgi:hypothetical protein